MIAPTTEIVSAEYSGVIARRGEAPTWQSPGTFSSQARSKVRPKTAELPSGSIPGTTQMQRKTASESLRSCFVLALPIFTARHQATIVGVSELNFCVRDGNRWTLMTINTNSYGWDSTHLLYIKNLSVSNILGDPYRIRTDVNGVRGRCLNHLTNGPLVHLQGLEPGTH